MGGGWGGGRSCAVVLLKLIPPSVELLVHKASTNRPGQMRDSRTCKQKQRRRVISINLSIKKYAVNKCMWHELMGSTHPAGTPEGSEENIPSGQ